MNYSWEIIKMIFYLCLVLGIIYLIANFVKKKFFTPTAGNHMETVGQLYLDSKKSLRLVKVKDQILLLSLTEGQVELLKEWPESEFDLNQLKDQANDDFGRQLKNLLGRYRRDQDE